MTVTADNITDVPFTNCALFSASHVEITDFLKQKNFPKFETESIQSSLWDYFDAFLLVTGDITATVDNNTDITFTNSTLFSTCQTVINDFFKQNNFLKFKTESMISSLRESFHASSVVREDITLTVDNNTDVVFTNCALLSTSKTVINDLFKQRNSTKFETERIKSSRWEYFDASILVAGDITATADNITHVTFRNCALFFTFQGEIHDFLNQNNLRKFEEESIQSSLGDHFTAFNLVTGDITVIAHNKSRCCIYKLPIIFTM